MQGTEEQGGRMWWGAIGVVFLLTLVLEGVRWSDPESRQVGLHQILCGEHADALPYLPLLLLLPLFWFGTRGAGRTTQLTGSGGGVAGQVSEPPVRVIDWLATLLVGSCSLLMSWSVANSFVDQQGDALPPAYHDEFSYLFQAETFLLGGTSTPSFSPRPELFDQMHVLNEGRFASRYFPGVGLWMLPYEAIGEPWLGHHVAGAIAAMFLFWIGRDLAGRLTGLVAGLLMGVSPGLVLFSNLLLAHHPTLVGLTFFIWCFLRMKRRLKHGTGGAWWACGAGVGLAYAMLCRPMTAAGMGLPFGLWFGWYQVTGRGVERQDHEPAPQRSFGQRLTIAIALAGPLLAGIGGMLVYNRSVTGDALVSPYQLYTDIYTPRHVYGFHNVERGSQKLGPKVLENYDRWAEDLDGPLAVRNVWRRLVSSLRWTLGVVPLTLSLLLLIGGHRRLRSTNRTTQKLEVKPHKPDEPPGFGDWWFILAAIVSLHVVHVPYWFEGIMGWHYVLESSLCWLLIAGGGTQVVIEWFRSRGSLAMRLWWGLLLSTAVLVNTVSVPLVSERGLTWWLWRSPLEQGILQVRFSRMKYAIARQEVEALRAAKRCVVLVIADPSDRHIDYVINTPTLDAPVLWVRVPEGETDSSSIEKIRKLFPDRTAIVFDAAKNQLFTLPAGK